MRPIVLKICAAAALLLSPAGGVFAQASDPSALLFEGSCKSCHTIGGGRKTGPDLKDVAQRRDRAWLRKFIQAPDKMLDSDPTALALLRECNNKRMPNLDLEPAEVEGLLKLIETASASGEVMGAAKVARVATAAGGRIGWSTSSFTHGCSRRFSGMSCPSTPTSPAARSTSIWLYCISWD